MSKVSKGVVRRLRLSSLGCHLFALLMILQLIEPLSLPQQTLWSAKDPQRINFSLIELQSPQASGRYRPWSRPLRFLIQGGVHGNEASTPKAVRWLARRYREGTSSLRSLDSFGIAIDFLPEANPGGLAGNQRLNPKGVNLNRNFPVMWGVTQENPGVHPFSEPETQGIEALVRERQYLAAVDIHGYVPWLVGPSYPQEIQAVHRNIKAREPQWHSPLTKNHGESPLFVHSKVRNHKLWIESLRQEMAFLPDYELHTAASLGDGGSFEDWAFWQMGVFAFCLEMAEPLVQDSLERLTTDLPNDLGITPQDEVRLIAYEKLIAKMFMHAIFLNKSSPIVGSTKN